MTSLYSQTATLISYLQKQQISTNESDISHAADNILKMIWDNVTKLCLGQINISPPEQVSESALERITLLLCTLVSPDKAKELWMSQRKGVKVQLELMDKPVGVGNEDEDVQMDVTVEQRTDVASEAQKTPGTSISEDLVKLGCQLTSSSFVAAKSSKSVPHLEFLSRLVAIFPISAIFREILNGNSCLESDEANAESVDLKTLEIDTSLHEAAMECFSQVLLPWIVSLDGGEMMRESGFVVDMVYVVVQCVRIEQKAAILDEICDGTRSPLVLHQLVTKVMTCDAAHWNRRTLRLWASFDRWKCSENNKNFWSFFSCKIWMPQWTSIKGDLQNPPFLMCCIIYVM